MTKEVLVSIRGLQFVDNEVGETASDEEIEQIETICPGEYYYRNDAHYIRYEEVMEDFPESVRNMIKLKGKEFSLWKKGPVNVQLVFSEGKKTMTDYFTPFGNILVAMDNREGNDGVRGLPGDTYRLRARGELSVHSGLQHHDRDQESPAPSVAGRYCIGSCGLSLRISSSRCFMRRSISESSPE